MTKRFKLKISRILSFKSCRSKDPTSLPFHPVPLIPRRPPPPVNPSADTTVSKRPSSFRLNVLTAFGCGSGRRRSSTPLDVNRRNSPSLSPPQTPTFQLESEGKWHVIAQVKEGEYETPRRKIYDGGPEKSDRRHSGKKERNSRRRGSTSSGEEETERESLLPSSTNLSPEDSSSEQTRVTKRRRHPLKKNKTRTEKRKNLSSASEEESESSSPARLSSFVQRFMPCAAAAVMVEGVAVVKRSEDPYEDFKGSMMEMIVEKKLFEVAELEQLLRCFLTLNAKRHHRAIVRAFSEVWVALFSGGNGGGRRSSFSTVRLSDYDEC